MWLASASERAVAHSKHDEHHEHTGSHEHHEHHEHDVRLGASLALGFAFMLIVERLSQGHGHSHGRADQLSPAYVADFTLMYTSHQL